MKKKVADLTEKEIEKICDKFFECSKECPLYRKKENQYRFCMTKEVLDGTKATLKYLKEENINDVDGTKAFCEEKIKELENDLQEIVEIEEWEE